MLRLASLLFSLISTTLMGVMVTGAIVAGAMTVQAIVTAAAIGFTLALPVTWAVARALTRT